MVHSDNSSRTERKVIGRPFPKGNKRGRPKNEVLAPSGSTKCIEGGDIAPAPAPVLSDIHNVVMGIVDQAVKEAFETPYSTIKTDNLQDETIETIDFVRGENTLSLRFSKKHNRMFRIQIFLNGESEIRPVTYTGATTGYAFWNLLKGALKK